MRIGRIWTAFISLQASHPLGLIGVQLTTVSFLALISFIVLELSHAFDNPYIGIITWMILPGVFITGLLLMLVARLIISRRAEAQPRIDLNLRRHRILALVFFALTILNLGVVGFVSYHSIEFSDSNSFCGEVCHTIMEPEYVAYQNSPHSRVHCVDCHIGPGAGFFVKYKINGLRQVVAALRGSYSRPIPAPVENLRPARETCEQCHWPEKFHGDELRIFRHYEEDEENTELTTVMMLKVGGRRTQGGSHYGIHWHTDRANNVKYYALDEQLQEIARVVVESDIDGTTIFDNTDLEITDSLMAHAREHTLDCIGCHNRPTHKYDLPEEALDNALAAGDLDQGLPYIRKLGRELLTAEYASKEEALAKIEADVIEFYRTEQPEIFHDHPVSVEQAGAVIAEMYDRNVYPSMRIEWGTYPSLLGHRDEGGCFRCHEGNFADETGVEIESDCDACHTILAYEEEEPEVLTTLKESAF